LIPIENAYTLISQYEQSIFTNAYERNVIISSPSTLIATLKTIANVRKVEYQNQNAIKIAQASGALYDKFVGLIEDIKQIGKQIDTTKTSYDSAIKKLSDGKGNLISRVELIKQLGAKATKNIPELS
jgi:DNA recombination protein RmuC